ncbi:MAG: hypothetical protein U1C51_05010 [Candidatus Izemoplasmatales bacterium]|nr:hypothetical protein [bacterium]MDZ4196594.1 hypothetical protein [Candidatus Izemoplasmatales bacterium]
MAYSTDIINIFSLIPKGASFVGEYRFYRFSYVPQDTANGLLCCRFVFTRSLTPQEHRQIVKETKINIAFDQFALPKDTVKVMFLGRGLSSFEKFSQTITQKMDSMIVAFQHLGLEQHQECTFCHTELESEAPELRNFNGYFVPIHQSCAEVLIEQIEQKAVHEKKNLSKLPFSLLLALIGAFIGLIPQAIALLGAQYYVGILYAIVPLGALLGYRLGKAPRTKIMIASVVVITFIVTISFTFLYFSMLVIEAGYQSLQAAMQYSDIQRIFYTEMFTTLLFSALGIWVSWRAILKYTSNKEEVINQLKY